MDIYESLRRFVIGRRALTNGDALGVTVQVPAVYITLLVIGPPASSRSVVDRISLVRSSARPLVRARPRRPRTVT